MPDTQKIDLKPLIKFIVDQKELKANLILDEGCFLEVEDPKPLIKVLNYFLNYLKQLSHHPIQVGLDLMHDRYLLTFLGYTQAEELSPIPDSVAEALKDYNATYEMQQQKGSFVQIKISFKK